MNNELSTVGDVIDRIKLIEGIDKDSDVAESLGISKGKLATAKARGSIPFRDVVCYSMKTSASLDWLLTGRGDMYLPGKRPNPLPPGMDPDSPAALFYDEPGETDRRGSEPAQRPSIESLSADQDDEFVKLPLYDVEASCGGGSLIHSEQIVDYLAFKSAWVRFELGADPQRLALIRASGDSMLPTVVAGDLLLLDLSIDRVEHDAIYALNLNGLLYVKRIQTRFDGTVIVKSDNPAYDEQRFSPDEAGQLRIIGRVIWMGKRT